MARFAEQVPRYFERFGSRECDWSSSLMISAPIRQLTFRAVLDFLELGAKTITR